MVKSSRTYVLSTISVLYLAVLVAAIFWLVKVMKLNKSIDDAEGDPSLGTPDWRTVAKENNYLSQSFEGAVVGLLLIIVLAVTHGHVLRK